MEESDGWFVYMTRNSFLQRLSQNYSFKLGGRHFQVSFDHQTSLHLSESVFEEDKDISEDRTFNLNVTEVQPSCLVRGDDSQLLSIAVESLEITGTFYCAFKIDEGIRYALA